MTDLTYINHNIDDLDSTLKVFTLLSREDKLEFLEKLKVVRTEAAGEFLTTVYPLENDKKVQKVIKTLLFRLKTVGIKIPEPQMQGEPVLKKIEEVREHRGLMSNYDADGTRIAVVAFEARKNTYVLIHSILHFSKGIIELANAPVNREGLKEVFTEYQKDSRKPFVVVEVSPRYASFLIEEASAHSGKYAEEVKEFKVFSARLGGEVHKPGDIYGLEVPDAADALSLERIMANDIFQPFTLSWDTLEDDRKQFNDIGGGSSIVLPPYMVAEKRQTFLAALLDRDALKSQIPLIKRLMEDYAYIFHRLGELEAFKGLIEILRDPQGLSKVLSFLAQRTLEKKEDQQSGIIVNPYEQVRP
ncbi:MAG: hypothetical protein A4E63_01795 [Syntrophorhabdus sp. PtaU1.Bin050]|nr:MAG: hypothetical protein A4E63_01795 [Syntrophorhabdus sp. PtaU1.Bin050]